MQNVPLLTPTLCTTTFRKRLVTVALWQQIDAASLQDRDLAPAGTGSTASMPNFLIAELASSALAEMTVIATKTLRKPSL